MADEVFAVAGQHVDDRNLNHRVAAGLQTHGGTGNVDKHLTSQGGVVDAHVELQALVLGLTADALADEVYAVTHIAHVVNRLHLEDVRLIVSKYGSALMAAVTSSSLAPSSSST